MNVLVITEDFRHDQYIAGPLIQRMLKQIGKPNAKVIVCKDPLLGGVSEAMNWRRIQEVLDRYRGMVQIFLLLVDRDDNPGRRDALDRLETQAAEELGSGQAFFAELAWQEMEAWALAGQKLPKEWNWNDIRAERDPKEAFFDKIAETRKLTKEPGQGRTTMGREAAQNYKRVCSRCPEIAALEKRLREWIDSSSTS